MRVGPHDGVSVLIRTGRDERSLILPCEDTARKSASQEAGQHLDLGLLSFQNYEK